MAVTLKVAGVPRATIWLGDWARMVGGVDGTLTVSKALELTTAPTRLETSTE